MANPDNRFGWRPVRTLSGAALPIVRCYVSASYATALYVGDPVDIDTTATNRANGVRVPTVIASGMTDGTYQVGIITAFEPDPTGLNRIYRPASTARYCQVCLGTPDVVFEIRDDGGVVLTNTAIGANAVGIATHSGDTTTGLSGFELDSGTTTAPSGNASNTMIIIGCADKPDNAWDGSTDTRMVWEVMLCNWRYLIGSAYGALGVLAA